MLPFSCSNGSVNGCYKFQQIKDEDCNEVSNIARCNGSCAPNNWNSPNASGEYKRVTIGVSKILNICVIIGADATLAASLEKEDMDLACFYVFA